MTAHFGAEWYLVPIFVRADLLRHYYASAGLGGSCLPATVAPSFCGCYNHPVSPDSPCLPAVLSCFYCRLVHAPLLRLRRPDGPCLLACRAELLLPLPPACAIGMPPSALMAPACQPACAAKLLPACANTTPPSALMSPASLPRRAELLRLPPIYISTMPLLCPPSALMEPASLPR